MSDYPTSIDVDKMHDLRVKFEGATECELASMLVAIVLERCRRTGMSVTAALAVCESLAMYVQGIIHMSADIDAAQSDRNVNNE